MNGLSEAAALDPAIDLADLYRTVVEHASEGIAVIQDGRFVYANPAVAAIAGLTPQRLVGTTIAATFHPEDLEAAARRQSARSEGTGHDSLLEFRIVRPDGDLRWVRVNVTGCVWRGRRASLGLVTDVTERRRAEEEARAVLEQQRSVNELKARFVSMASHEFRTPLAAIFSASELLKRYGDRLPDTEKHAIYESIGAGVRRMTELLDKVLTFGRAEAGWLECEPRRVDLQALCAELVGQMRDPQPPGAGPRHEFRLEWRAGAPEARVDETLLRHILGNLLTNAVKYSPAGGEVVLEATRGSDGLRLVVSDQGIGIPPADVPKLFGVFHRGGNVGSVPGTGLGLAIVRHAVRLHGGAVSVASTPGRGSRFTVTLPEREE